MRLLLKICGGTFYQIQTDIYLYINIYKYYYCDSYCDSYINTITYRENTGCP